MGNLDRFVSEQKEQLFGWWWKIHVSRHLYVICLNDEQIGDRPR